MAKVTLVRPPIVKSNSILPPVITPPLALAYLAGSLRAAGHQPVIVDAIGEAPFLRMPCLGGRMIAIGLPISEIVAHIPEDTEVIGISGMFSQEWPYTKQVVEAIRRRFSQTLIVAGGEHFTALPLFTLETCPAIDLCVLGEGEEAIVEIADRVDKGSSLDELRGIAIRRGGTPVLMPPRARIRDVDDIPPPAWDLTPIGNYLDRGLSFGVNRGRSIPMLATRGCPYQCTFCSSPSMWTTRYVARDPAKVLDEIQGYIDSYKAENIDFYDLTAIVKKEWILAFCRKIEERGMKFTWQLPSGTRSEALDGEVCAALYRAGCRDIAYAPESGSSVTLKLVKKRLHLDKMMVSMRAAVKEGMHVQAHIVFGFPGETRNEAWRSIILLARMALAGAHHMRIFTFTPYPGSELFNRLRESSKLPKLDDEYFLFLADIQNLTAPVSYCDSISGKELAALRFVGYFAFFALQFVSRPWRVLRTIYNAAFSRQESHADKALRELMRNRRILKNAGAGQTVAS
jgi:radical SAM superfamily enzyme YgiQ (UPF0313 family)